LGKEIVISVSPFIVAFVVTSKTLINLLGSKYVGYLLGELKKLTKTVPD
jgi:hypothetical protein